MTTHRFISPLLAAGLVFLAPMAPTGAQDNKDIAVLRQTSKAFAALAKQALPAVVFVKVEKMFNVRARGYPYVLQYPLEGQGAGFLISKDGTILTSNHIVGDADKITVKLHDGRSFEAKRIGSDPHSEVAVIKIDGDNFPTLPIGDSDALDIGEWVIAIGNPFGLSETLTVGVVSAKGRSNIGISDYEDFIQTDAAINLGNSGGPLLNTEGKVIGINTAIFSQTGGSLGIGFAVPINMAMRIKEQLVKDGKITRGYLGVGIQDLSPDLAETLQSPPVGGIVVNEVMAGSPAEQADVKPGDVIQELDGKPMDSVNAFRSAVALSPPGKEISLKILRDGKAITLKAVIGILPDAAAARGHGRPSLGDRLGLEVVNPQAPGRRSNLDPNSGVVVNEVRPGSPADGAGIQPGNLISSVNRRPVRSLDDFNAALALSEKNGVVLLLVKDPPNSRFLVLRLD